MEKDYQITGIQRIVDECGALYQKCFVKDIIRYKSQTYPQRFAKAILCLDSIETLIRTGNEQVLIVFFEFSFSCQIHLGE